MLKKLSQKDLKKELTKIDSDWVLNDKLTEIQKKFIFSNPLEAFMFLTKICIYSEVAKIYPKIELAGPKVKVTLSSTAKLPFNKTDFELITKIDKVFYLSTEKKILYHY
jgi:pterin-4a-carbinolamine dehydratase